MDERVETDFVELKPRFVHHQLIRMCSEELFRVFQLPDPMLREVLFSALLVENAILLLQGTYGTGKTQFVHLVRKLMFSDGDGGFEYDYETCHQDLTAFDVLYHLDLAELQKGREVVHPKAMVSARLKFFNEIQRAGTNFFNALLPLFSERRVTYRDCVFEVPESICIMDQNPHDSGSSDIPEAFLDRVDFCFHIPAIHLEETIALLNIRQTGTGVHWGDLEFQVEPVLEFSQISEIWQDVKSVSIPRKMVLLSGMLTDSLRLCIAAERSTSRVDFDLECGECQFAGELCAQLLKVPGQRISNSLLKLSQALAWFEGSNQISASHLLAAFPYCLSHRLSLRPEERRKKPSVFDWVQDVAVGEILRPKIAFWLRAIDAFDRRDTETLEEMGSNDLVVRELFVMATDSLERSQSDRRS